MNIEEVQKAKLQFGIIGNDPALLRAIDTAVQVAHTDLTVLITGESGVGKEFFPKIVHSNSVRKHGKYIAVNCGATLGASLCFASPFSTPPNALVMPAGQYKFSDYIKVGLPLQIILGIVMILVLPLLFPF